MKYFIIILSMMTLHLSSEPNILLQLQSPPKKVIDSILYNDPEFITYKMNKIASKSLATISRKMFKGYLLLKKQAKCSGIPVLYSGYCNFSDPAGFASFPLRHSPATKITIVITSGIVPEKIGGNTIGYFRVSDPTKALCYTCEKAKGVSNIWGWGVIKDKLEKDIIPSHALIIITKPKTLFVEEGNFISQEESNVILPPAFFVINNMGEEELLCKMLDAAVYHEPIRFEKVQPQPTIEQKIMQNT